MILVEIRIRERDDFVEIMQSVKEMLPTPAEKALVERLRAAFTRIEAEATTNQVKGESYANN